ncbi:MAG: hypothetical protein IT230_11565 [Flavobacteriales bacterium]|nr:hypothetical protein [Flavobacteriales bacterium]
MRTTSCLLLILISLRAAAQCCCAGHTVLVSTPGAAHLNGQWQYTAWLSGTEASGWRIDSVPGNPFLLGLSVATGCGLPQVTWEVFRLGDGGSMRVKILGLYGDVAYPTIQLPWTANTTLRFDMHDVMACMAANEPPESGHGPVETVCRTGSVRLSFGARAEAVFEPLDLAPWSKEPGAARLSSAPAEARFQGGPDAMQQYLEYVLDKDVIEALPGPQLLTGIAAVESDGSVYALTLDSVPCPGLAKAVRIALLRSGRWEPAVAERPSIPEGPRNYQPYRQLVHFRVAVDPAMIRRRPDGQPSPVDPEPPDTTDVLRLPFR